MIRRTASDRKSSSPVVVEQASELLKERIYSTITLLALLATLWQAADHFTPRGAFVSVLGTALTLWLAIAVASRMSYHVVHGKKITVRELGKILAIRKALVAPAVPALLFIAMSWVGLLSLSTALMASIVALILSFALYSLLAGLRIHSTWYEIILSSLLETALGAGIILLKIAVGH